MKLINVGLKSLNLSMKKVNVREQQKVNKQQQQQRQHQYEQDDYVTSNDNSLEEDLVSGESLIKVHQGYEFDFDEITAAVDPSVPQQQPSEVTIATATISSRRTN